MLHAPFLLYATVATTERRIISLGRVDKSELGAAEDAGTSLPAAADARVSF
jgi:hypothetical protein